MNVPVVGTVFWWLSFADPERPSGQRFLGACLIRALPDPRAAAIEATSRGCNPGGEIMLAQLPDSIPVSDTVFDRYGNRLLNMDECHEFEVVMTPQLGGS